MRGNMIAQQDLQAGARISYLGSSGVIVEVLAGKVRINWESGNLAGVQSTDPEPWVLSGCDLVAPAPQPAPVGGMVPKPWAVGDVCYRNDFPLLVDEILCGVTIGCRGVIVEVVQLLLGYSNVKHVGVQWDCENEVRNYRPDGVECKISRTPPNGQPAPQPWVVGAQVKRNVVKYRVDADEQLVDQIPVGMTGEIVRKGEVSTTVLWANGAEVGYLRAHCYMQIVRPQVASACTRCAKPWIYEPSPSGVCAECKIVQAML